LEGKVLEADLKRAVSDYLQIGENQGKWVHLRLNSGDFIEVRGDTRRRIKGCPKGTADYIVLQATWVNAYPTHINVNYCRAIFLELKSKKGKQSKEQKEFEIKVGKERCEYFVVRSIEELEEILH
jgi:hypothetical protein